MNRHFFLVTGVAALCVSVAGNVHADCNSASIGQMYLSYVKQIGADDSPAAAFKDVRKQLESIANDHDVADFSITSSDMSVSSSSYNQGLDLHISVSVQLAANVDVVDAFFSETRPQSFSYGEAPCFSNGESDEDHDAAADTQSP